MSEATPVTATIWEYIMPIDRGDRYEDPLDEALSNEDLGEVTGGGSQLSDECGIEFVDIEIDLNDLERGLEVVVQTLESRGAPKGSVLQYGEDQTLEFGICECLAVFLDGINLSEEIYQSANLEEILDQIVEILNDGELGEFRSYWSGNTETALFFYGLDAEAMYLALESTLSTIPLCQNARIVVRHGNASQNPRTIRLPMHP